MEFDMTKVVEEITMQAIENQEEFIFETINPYCEDVLRMKISKEELKQILLNGIQKQQPCEDCISRAKALEMLGDVPENWTDTEKEIQEVNDYRWFKSILEELPSVTPQQRVGRWILEEVKDEDGRPYDIKYFCSECQAERPPIWDDYCGACGAKMEVEE